MKSFAKVVLIIAAAALALGLALTVFGFMTGAAPSVSWNRDGISIPDRNPGRGSAARQVIISEKELAAFTGIDINADLADIRFIPSDSYGFEIAYADYNTAPRWSVDNGTLKIVKRDANRWENNNWFSIDLSFLPFIRNRSIDEYIYIYYPASAEFDKAVVNVSAGNVDISAMTAVLIDVKNSFGAVKASGASCHTLKVDMSAGALSLEDIQCAKTDISNDFGEVKLIRFATDSADIRLSSGKLDMRGVTAEDMRVKSDFGEIAGRDVDFGNSWVRSSAGKIRLEGDLRGGADIGADFGAIELALTRPRGYYDLDLGTDFGSIRIDNDKYSGMRMSSLTGNESRPLIKASASSGSIEIQFGR